MHSYLNKIYKNINRFICLLLLITFPVSQVMAAQPYTNLGGSGIRTSEVRVGLPPVGTMIMPTAAFEPALIKGVTVFPDNPLRFDFIVDTGEADLEGDALKSESNKLIKYFLASLTVPEEDLWVNLSPYEADRIIPEKFGHTEMGRDLLAQDYILKQLTASLMYPEDELGEKFWDRVHEKAYEEYGVTDIPVDTFNKVWIVPEKAVVYENAETNTAFVVESRLKVMLEEDYEAMTNETWDEGRRTRDVKNVSRLTSDVLRNIIIPAIEQEVNEGTNFAQLRQIYHSLILATWFKRNLKKSVLGKVYVGKNKVSGVDIEDKQAKEKIYTQYLESFKQGAYDYIKEDYDPATQQIVPRKYFSGGLVMDMSMLSINGNAKDVAISKKASHVPVYLKAIKDDNAMTNKRPHWDPTWPKPTDAEVDWAKSRVNYFMHSLLGEHPEFLGTSFFVMVGPTMKKLRNIYYDYPQVAAAILFSFGIGHEHFEEVFPSEENVSVLEPKLVGNMVREGLSLFLQNEKLKVDNKLYDVKYSMKGTSLILSSFNKDQLKEVWNRLPDENTHLFIHDVLLEVVNFYSFIESPADVKKNTQKVKALGLIPKRVTQEIREYFDLEGLQHLLDIGIFDNEGHPAHWNPEWEEPTEDEFEYAKNVFEAEILIDYDNTFYGGKIFPRIGIAGQKLDDYGRGRVLRAMFYLYPDIAGAILLSFPSGHDYWRYILYPKGFFQANYSVEPELLAKIINHGVNLYKHDYKVNTVDGLIEVNYDINGIGGLLGELTREQLNPIFKDMNDENLILVVNSIIKYWGWRDFGKVEEILGATVLNRLKKIQLTGADEIREYLSLKRKPASPKIIRTTVPIPKVAGKSVGRLIIFREEPSREILKNVPPYAIVAMDFLPRTMGKFQGILTLQDEPAETSHAQWQAKLLKVPHAVWPETNDETLNFLEGKIVVFDVGAKEVELREADKQEQKDFEEQKHLIRIPSIKLPAVELDGEEYYLSSNHPNLINHKIVGHKAARVHQLEEHNIKVSDPRIKVEIAKGSAIPFRTFQHLLKHNGQLKTFQNLMVQLANVSFEGAENILTQMRNIILSQSFQASDAFWKQMDKDGELNALLSMGLFVRPSTNAEDDPEHPGLGAGRYITVQNVTSREALWKAIKEVYASVWLANPYEERRQFSIDERTVHPSIWLLPSVPPDYSGTLHTSRVMLENPDQFLIEIVQGLGESLRGNTKEFKEGRPTQIIWDKINKEVIEKHAGTKEKQLILNKDGGTSIVPKELSKKFLNHLDANRLIQSLIEIGQKVEMIFGKEEIEVVLAEDKMNKGSWTITLVQTKNIDFDEAMMSGAVIKRNEFREDRSMVIDLEEYIEETIEHLRWMKNSNRDDVFEEVISGRDRDKLDHKVRKNGWTGITADIDILLSEEAIKDKELVVKMRRFLQSYTKSSFTHSDHLTKAEDIKTANDLIDEVVLSFYKAKEVFVGEYKDLESAYNITGDLEERKNQKQSVLLIGGGMGVAAVEMALRYPNIEIWAVNKTEGVWDKKEMLRAMLEKGYQDEEILAARKRMHVKIFDIEDEWQVYDELLGETFDMILFEPNSAYLIKNKIQIVEDMFNKRLKKGGVFGLDIDRMFTLDYEAKKGPMDKDMGTQKTGHIIKEGFVSKDHVFLQRVGPRKHLSYFKVIKQSDNEINIPLYRLPFAHASGQSDEGFIPFDFYYRSIEEKEMLRDLESLNIKEKALVLSIGASVQKDLSRNVVFEKSFLQLGAKVKVFQPLESVGWDQIIQQKEGENFEENFEYFKEEFDENSNIKPASVSVVVMMSVLSDTTKKKNSKTIILKNALNTLKDKGFLILGWYHNAFNPPEGEYSRTKEILFEFEQKGFAFKVHREGVSSRHQWKIYQVTFPKDKNKVVQDDFGIDASMMVSPKGGIDFNANTLPLDVQGGGVDYNFPVPTEMCIDDDNDGACERVDIEALENMPLTGFTPIIFQITPVTNLNGLLGIVDEEEPFNYSNFSQYLRNSLRNSPGVTIGVLI